MRKRLPYLLTAALASALIAAGCGDDDDEEPTTGATGVTGASGAEPISEAEFVSRADEICREGEEAIDTAAEGFFGTAPGQGEPPQEEQLRFAEEIGIPSIEQQIDDIAALPPPEGQEDLFNEFLDQARADLETVKQDPSLLLSDAGGETFADTNELAEELGLAQCAED
jgi:hypothetical protein